MRFFFIVFLVFSCLQISYNQIQRRQVSKIDEKEFTEESKFSDKITADLKLGNLGIFGNLNLSCKVQAGYPVTSYLSGGLGAKVFYSQIFIASGPDAKYIDLGSFLFARGKLFKQFFVQAEYHFTAYDHVNSTFPGANIYYPSLGIGYVSGYNKWRYGVELNFLLDELARAYQGSVLEYWIGAFYNF